MGKFFVEVFCGKLCGGGEVKAFIDRSSVKYPSTFARYRIRHHLILRQNSFTFNFNNFGKCE
jgi:hypothetical protein